MRVEPGGRRRRSWVAGGLILTLLWDEPPCVLDLTPPAVIQRPLPAPGRLPTREPHSHVFESLRPRRRRCTQWEPLVPTYLDLEPLSRGVAVFVRALPAALVKTLVMITALSRFVAALVLSLVLQCSAAPQEYGTVELLRDRWGVPHIFSDTDAGAMYGLGHATAQERGFQMTYGLRIMQGRLAQVVGPRTTGGRKETAVDSDRKMRTFG